MRCDGKVGICPFSITGQAAIARPETFGVLALLGVRPLDEYCIPCKIIKRARAWKNRGHKGTTCGGPVMLKGMFYLMETFLRFSTLLLYADANANSK